MLSPEQLEERLNYLTGSDAAVVCGLSPWKTPVALWMEKTRRSEQVDLSHNNYIKFGNYMEDGVAKWFEAESGKTVVKEPKMLTHKHYDWMAGNVDFAIVGENAILECKTAGKSDRWGDSENTIPDEYLMQVAHYCAVGNFDRAYIAVVFTFSREFRWYVYDRDLNLENKLIEREKHFWENHVLTDTAPEAKTESDILAFYKKGIENPLIATAEIENLIGQYLNADDEAKRVEDIQQNIKDKIAIYMQDHENLYSTANKLIATWRFIKETERLDTKKIRADHPELCEKYIINGKKNGEPSRKFVIKGDK